MFDYFEDGPIDTTYTSEYKNKKLVQCKHAICGDSHYLALKWQYETTDGVYELSVPKLDITDICSFPEALVIQRGTYNNPQRGHLKTLIGCQLVDIPMELTGRQKFYYKVECIEEKTREMTLSEIEAKLGHKVKIVNDKK